MKSIFNTLKKNIKYWLVSLLVLPFFLWWISNGWDLLRQIIEPAYEEEIIIGLWNSKETVWKNVFKWGTSVELGLSVRVPKTENWKPVCRFGSCSSACAEINETNTNLCKRQWSYEWGLGVSAWISKEPSVIVKITRMLLVLTITLSVTMILYNGMMYIVQTWQWKDGKSLKNIAYIVVWILIALFSVIIMRIIQSIPTTIGDYGELPTYGYEQDKAAISQNNKWASRRTTLFSF